MSQRINDRHAFRMYLAADGAHHLDGFEVGVRRLMGDGRFTADELEKEGSKPVRHNGCHEWGDIRSRHVASAKRRAMRVAAKRLRNAEK